MNKNTLSSLQEKILIDQEYFIHLVNDIDAAVLSIDMETYIFAIDQVGEEIAAALSRAAKRGLRVRLLIDGVGTRNWTDDFFLKLKNSGVLVKVYHPLFWSLVSWPLHPEMIKNIFHYITFINSRNHRKTCVIDQEIVYIGGANISIGTLVNNEMRKWHDITARATGVNLSELFFAFDKAWGCLSFTARFRSLFTKFDIDPVLRLNYSWRKRHQIYKGLLRKVQDANQRIWITNAYFIPRKLLLFKLIKAAKKGIDVRIVVPKTSDVVGMTLLRSSFYYVLLKAGVTILHNDSGILHTKLLIIDEWYCVGSSNLNYRSFYHDLEADIKIQMQAAQNQLENKFINYCQQSHKVTMGDLVQKSLLQKLALRCLWLIRFMF